MGLLQNDKLPYGITLQDAYTKIRKWYLANINLTLEMESDYGTKSAELIMQIPLVDEVSDLEIRAILGEIIYGYLEWSYHKDDGEYKMAAYAFGAFETSKVSWSLNQEEQNRLKESKFWKYLFLAR